ncbi:hypothetical protein PWT90_11224 [Aphanocladium album]|nr:hypothetical protein PWT90_11224 [Aphanocladium album]
MHSDDVTVSTLLSGIPSRCMGMPPTLYGAVITSKDSTPASPSGSKIQSPRPPVPEYFELEVDHLLRCIQSDVSVLPTLIRPTYAFTLPPVASMYDRLPTYASEIAWAVGHWAA